MNLLIVALILLGLGGCEKETMIDVSGAGSIVIDASDTKQWVYFSFEKDTIVSISDPENSLEWDMGFHLFDVRLNGGTSGMGQGASLATGRSDFAGVVTAPQAGYVLNDSVEIAIDLSVIPPLTEVVAGDTLMSSWIKMTYGASGPEFVFSDEVFVIRTAKGKYAKVWLKDFFDSEGQYGVVTMQYRYQPDGSRNLGE